MNKKGMTLVEIIISIALISIVLVFLFSLLVTVNDMNDEADINSTYLINKSLILRNIEDDLSKANKVNISTTCTNGEIDGIQSFYSSYNVSEYEIKYQASECIQFEYTINDGENDIKSTAYLAIYYYQPKEEYVISYIHGNTKATRILPEFEKYNVNQTNGKIKENFEIKYETQNNFHKITVPIIGNDGKDYSILISYYGTMSVNI